MNNLPNSNLRELARQKVSNRLALTGQLVPAPIVEDAVELLACIWSCGEQYGVTLTEWRPVVMLEQVTVDVLVLTKRGGGDDG